MLSRANRFHGHNSLNWAYKHGSTIRDPKISLRYASNPRRRSFRAAVVVSRKVNRSAVIRNRIRRRVYECIRPHAGDIKQTLDLIFMVYSDEVASMPTGELEGLIRRLLDESRSLD